MKKPALILLLLMLALSVVFAQRRFFGGRFDGGNMIRTEGGEWVDQTKARTARAIASPSCATPNWTDAPGFEKDVVTFVRIIRDRDPNGLWSAGSWIADFPDSDLNFSFRLQQLT